jgi:hypothetical protein
MNRIQILERELKLLKKHGADTRGVEMILERLYAKAADRALSLTLMKD